MSSKQLQIATEIEELKYDAFCVLADIVKMSSHIRDTGSDIVSELTGGVTECLNEKLTACAKRIRQ